MEALSVQGLEVSVKGKKYSWYCTGDSRKNQVTPRNTEPE